MVSIYFIMYTCLELRFLDVEPNPGPGVLFLVPAKYSTVMCGSFPGTSVQFIVLL